MLLFVVIATCFIPAKGTNAPLLVYPRLVEERTTDGRMLLHVHDGLTLNLRKASVAAPEFRVLTEENGEDVTHFYSGEELDRYLYEDETKLATIHVMETDNGHEIEGVLGPDRRIQPMPTMERSAEGLIAHMIHPIENKRMLDEALLPSDMDKWAVSGRDNGNEEGVPKSVTIELFIVSGSSHHKEFNQTKFLILYLCVTVNSLNLRYAAASSPRIQLLLTGVQQDKDDSYKVGQEGYMNAAGTLENFKAYVVTKMLEFGKPDVVYLMTADNVYSTSGGKADTNSLGIGYVTGVCTEFRVALGEDTPGFYNGMHTMTHETAHVLGSEHDESAPTPSVKDHPGSMSCPWKAGFIMSYVNNGPDHHKFSSCSINQMRHVITIRGRSCWTVSKTGKTRPGKYAGMFVSLQRLCKRLFPDRADVVADTDSQYLEKCKVKCKYSVVRYEYLGNSRRMVTTWYSKTGESVDYMQCAKEKVCMQGLCVKKPAETPKKPKVKKAEKTEKPPKQKN